MQPWFMLIMWMILKLNDVPLHVDWHIYLCHFALHATGRYTTAVTVIKFIRQDETKKALWLPVNTVTKAPLAMTMHPNLQQKQLHRCFFDSPLKWITAARMIGLALNVCAAVPIWAHVLRGNYLKPYSRTERVLFTCTAVNETFSL